MNILFLSELFYPHGGGAELATYLYAKFLAQEGFNIIVVTNKFSGEREVTKNQRLRIYRVPLFGNNGRSIKYSILKRSDVLFSNFMSKLFKWADMVYVPRFWFTAIPLAKRKKKPTITHLHDYIPICPLSNFFNFLKKEICSSGCKLCFKCVYMYEKSQNKSDSETIASIILNSTVGKCYGKLVKNSNVIICVSKEQKNIIIEKEPSLLKKIHMVYNPIPEEISDIEIRGDNFGYFGGPNYLKGFRVLYDAIKLINSKEFGVKILATKFPMASEKYLNSIRMFGVQLYRSLSRCEFNKIYEQIRTVLVPSIWPEPWPYVVVEAIISGRFLIASNIGGIHEQVEGCKGVLLFDPWNHVRLAEAMQYASNLDRKTIIELGQQSKEAFLKKFKNENSIKSFVKIIESLNKKGGRYE